MWLPGEEGVSGEVEIGYIGGQLLNLLSYSETRMKAFLACSIACIVHCGHHCFLPSSCDVGSLCVEVVAVRIACSWS